MRTLTWNQVYARRLAVSHLVEPAPTDELRSVVQAVCGVHAQLMTGAELALSARVDGVTREAVRELLWDTRALAKANTIRGTLHVHPAGELGLWKSPGVTRERWRERQWLDWQGLTLADAELLRERLIAVLDDGEPRTREEIGAGVGGALGEHIATDSWGHFFSPASDVICHGPPRGRHVTFVRCDRWLRDWQPVPGSEALRAACLRYLQAYGPACRDELEHWLSRRIPDEAFAGLEEVDVEGHRAFVVPGTVFPEHPPRGVRLLWHYDVYVIGCHSRDHLIPQHRERVFLRGAGPSPALLVDGRVAGTWSRKVRGRRTEIRVEPFMPLKPGRLRDLGNDAARVARTYGSEADLLVE